MQMLISNDMTVFQAVAQFVSYAVLALFTENILFTRALGVSRLIKLINDPGVKTWQYCIPVILVQLFSAPMGWAAHNLFVPALRVCLPDWLPVNALRPVIYLTATLPAFALVWLLLFLVPKRHRGPCRAQLPAATFNCVILGTLFVSANQNFNLVQCLAFGLGSGIGYLFAVLMVDEARRRLRSKAIPHIFKGLPSTLIYIGILSLALYGLVGHGVS